MLYYARKVYFLHLCWNKMISEKKKKFWKLDSVHMWNVLIFFLLELILIEILYEFLNAIFLFFNLEPK